MAAAPAMAPSGMADQASTPATLMTRPYRWPGTMAWRSEEVLMFASRPNPDDAAHRASAAGYEPRTAMAVTASPLTARAPRTVTANDSRAGSVPRRR